MYRVVLLIFVAVVTALSAANGQLAVRIRSDKDTFLVYEAIPVNISIQNYSGRTIQLEADNSTPWLEFAIVDEDNNMVRAVSKPATEDAILIPPGQTISHTIDLLPLYELRSRGSYRIQAVVNGSSGATVSSPLHVTLTNGRELWSQVVGLPVTEGGKEEYRTCALFARRGSHEDVLFISVRDEPHGVVYSLVPLGGFLPTSVPQTRMDRSGNVHVLFQNGPRSYGYMVVDSAAKVVTRAAFSDFLSRPELVSEDAEVTVRGGEQTYPKPERILTEEEITPPPPAKPKDKRHWWWRFEPRAPSEVGSQLAH